MAAVVVESAPAAAVAFEHVVAAEFVAVVPEFAATLELVAVAAVSAFVVVGAVEGVESRLIGLIL